MAAANTWLAASPDRCMQRQSKHHSRENSIDIFPVQEAS